MDRNDLLTRITKLRLHAEGTNSEAEAMLFAEKAAQLMAAYEVSEAELAEAEADGRIVLDIIETKVESRRNRNGGRYGHAHRAAMCASGINALTHTKSVQWNDADRSVSFLGHRPDVEFATFLYEVIRDAMDREYDRWKADQTYSVPKSAKGAFQIAMGNRISSRLYALAANIKRDRQETARAFSEGGDASAPQITDSARDHTTAARRASESASKALVLVDMKQEEINTEFAKKHPRLGRARGFNYTHNSTASSAGRAAGDRVGLNRGVGRSTQGLLA